MSLQQDQASSLEVAIKNLREAAKGYRRGNERQKSALDEKKRSKVEMEQEQTTLIKETLSINREIDEVERQIVTLKRSSSKNSQEIENAEAKNLKLRNSVISKKRELDKEARRHGAMDNDKFDKSAFDEKERQVKSIPINPRQTPPQCKPTRAVLRNFRINGTVQLNPATQNQRHFSTIQRILAAHCNQAHYRQIRNHSKRSQQISQWTMARPLTKAIPHQVWLHRLDQK